ncbi:hypothetical protein BDR22DRAFT_895590 [Usnea florida]
MPSTVADQWFLEQQVQTALPAADWRSWVDPRPPAIRQPFVQLPKWWSHRTCNIALATYGSAHLVVPPAFLKWSTIRETGYQLALHCVSDNSRGGAANILSRSSRMLVTFIGPLRCPYRFASTGLLTPTLLQDIQGRAVVTILMWRGGAPFDAFMNRYEQGQFPKGIDPLLRPSLLTNTSLVNALEMANVTSTFAALALGSGTAVGSVATS